MSDGRTTRRLAAILAADVVGYSRMMGTDEAGTLAALKRHRETTFYPAVAEHSGRVVKLIGDGTLVEFASVVDAVNCALTIQRALQSDMQPGSTGITLRIGACGRLCPPPAHPGSTTAIEHLAGARAKPTCAAHLAPPRSAT